MGIIIRQGFKGTLVIYTGVLIGAGNMLWLFPKFLSPEEIGLVRVVIEVAILFAALSSFGISSIADRFFGFFKDEENKHRGFFLLLIVYPFIGFMIVSSLFLIFRDVWIESYRSKSSLLIDYFYHIVPLTFLILYLSILEAYSRVHLRIVVPLIVREVFLRCVQALVVILYHYQIITFEHLIVMIIASYLVGILLMVGYIKSLNRLYLFSAKSFYEDKALLKQILIYGLVLFLGGATGLIAAKVDVVLLSAYSGLGATGIYSIAFFIATIIEIPRRSISQISSPLIGQFWKEKNIEKIHEVYRKTSLNQLIIGLYLFLLIWCSVDLIIGLMPNSEVYRAGKYVILIIGLSRLSDMVTGVNSEIILTSPFYKVNLLLTILAGILTIAANYFLIREYGMNGAALATMISYIVFNIIKVVIIKVKVNIQPFSLKTLFVFLIGLLAFVIIKIIPPVFADSFFTSVLGIAVNSAVITLVFIGTVYFLRLSDELNSLVSRVFKGF